MGYLRLFIHVIDLFIHSYSIQHNREQLQDNFIIFYKTLDIKTTTKYEVYLLKIKVIWDEQVFQSVSLLALTLNFVQDKLWTRMNQ